MRFVPASENRGKRGALRVCYAYFPEFGTVVFLAVYAKNQSADLTPSEKSAFAGLIERLQKQLASRRYRRTTGNGGDG